MSFVIVNIPTVRVDIKDAVEYYNKVSPKLAKTFIFRLKEVKKYIQNNPYAFEEKYKNVRTVLLKQFPFHIHYLIDTAHSKIVILAIVHAYRNPIEYTT